MSRFTLLVAKLESLRDDGVKKTSGIPDMAFAIEWESGVLISARALPPPLPALQVCARVTNLDIANKYMEQWENPDKTTHPKMGFYLDECMDASVVELTDAGSFDTMLVQIDKLNEIRQFF
jgi:hypothetical protein